MIIREPYRESNWFSLLIFFYLPQAAITGVITEGLVVVKVLAVCDLSWLPFSYCITPAALTPALSVPVVAIKQLFR